ncbi:glycosyltransferase [Niallia alba]|uniref:CDP-glycerol glycerophosphotransferase family protein n=1 Tax=Niallia alba TaxID=2729105 RepID=UPI0039A1FB55
MAIKNFFNKIFTLIELIRLPYIKRATDREFKMINSYTDYFKKKAILHNTILYQSHNGMGMSDSPLAIFKELISHPSYKGYKHIWVVNDINNPTINQYSSMSNVKFVKLHSDEYLMYLASAKYLINNHSFPSYFQKREEQIYVNTWHNTPSLYDESSNYGRVYANTQRNFLQVDYLLTDSLQNAKNLMESYDLDGIFKGKILAEGYPRIDLVLNSNSQLVKKQLSNCTTYKSNQKLIIYSTTWKNEYFSKQNDDIKLTDFLAQLKLNIPTGFQLLLNIEGLPPATINENLKDLIIPSYMDINEILSITDFLISDNMHIINDFAFTNRPIIFFTNEEVDSFEIPVKICTDLTAVTKAMRNMSNTLTSDIKYGSETSKITPKIIDSVLNNNSSWKIYSIANEKTNLIFYCGGFLNNGITTSAINLINNIDYDRFNVIVVDNIRTDKASIENFKKINHNATKLIRVGAMNISVSEWYIHHYITKKGLINNRLEKYLPFNLYKREAQRLFGNIDYDVAIDFSGYVPFWSFIFAFGGFKKKAIYQHNDMHAEYYKKINNKFKHKQKMNLIFPIYKYFDKIIAVSKNTRDENIKNLSKYMEETKAVYVHNCIDSEKIKQQIKVNEEMVLEETTFLLSSKDISDGNLQIKGIKKPTKNKINFVTMGRLSPEKDHEKLLRAFKEFYTKKKDSMLYIIGEGVLETQLKELTYNLGLQKNVIFTGQLTNPYSLISQCDCFILSSNHEGQPMVLLENLIIGMPIIATDIPGNRSILQEDYGLIVENSVNGLVQGMEQYLNNNLPRFNMFNYTSYNKEALDKFYKEIL